MNYIKYFLILLTLLIQTVSAQSVDNPKITYFHNDITGTPIAASDEQGNIIWREERLAYGEIKVDPLKPKTLEEFSVGFTGHQADRESGLTYAKARYYNPNIGRFYAPDPIPFRQNDLVSFNRYAYAGNNPYRFFDPMGMDKWLITQKHDNTISDAEAKIIAGAIGIVLTPVAMLQGYHENGLNAGMAADIIPYGKFLHKAKEVVTTATKPANEVKNASKVAQKATTENEDIISIFKAPAPGKGADQFKNGYRIKDFCEGNQCIYFAKEKDLADEYAKHFEEGVIELRIPKRVYNSRLQKYEFKYQDTEWTELEIPHSGFDVLNEAERKWHKH